MSGVNDIGAIDQPERLANIVIGDQNTDATLREVAHELLALELLALLLEAPTDDSVELAVSFTKDVGYTLQEVAPQVPPPPLPFASPSARL